MPDLWLPSKPDEITFLLTPDAYARGLEFGLFWLRMTLEDHRRRTGQWQEFYGCALDKAIKGAEEHELEGFMFPRPPSYWVREMKQEIYDIGSYGAFALWAAADYPDPRPNRNGTVVRGPWNPPLPADPDTETMG